MAGRIDGWRHELMNAWTEGQFNERMDACMDGGMKEGTDWWMNDTLMDGWMKGGMDGWMDGDMN